MRSRDDDSARKDNGSSSKYGKRDRKAYRKEEDRREREQLSL